MSGEMDIGSIGPRKLTRSFSVVNWKPSDTQGHRGSSWKFWRRLSIRSRGHETGRSKTSKLQTDDAISISKADIGEPSLDPGHRTQALPDVVVEGAHNLPVFNANAIPPPKPPRLFLSKTPSNAGSRSSSAESISDDKNGRNNNNNSPQHWSLLDSDDFTLETRKALGHIASTLRLKDDATTQGTQPATGKSSPPLFNVVEEDNAEEDKKGDGLNHVISKIGSTQESCLSENSKTKMGNSFVPLCLINDNAVPTPVMNENDNNGVTNGRSSQINNNNLTTAPSPPSSQPPPLTSSSPPRTRNASGKQNIYNQYHQNGYGTVPRKQKIVTPELSQKRYRRPRSRKLSSCDDQVSRQWRIMTSVLDLMCQRLDPYPLLDPLKRAGVLTNIQLQSFLGHCDRRSICEGLVDIIGKGTPKCLSVFSAAIAACPGNCTEILEILQAMREIDKLVYDIPEPKPKESGESHSGNDESAPMLTTMTNTTTTTTATTTVSSSPTTVTEDKILNFDIGYLSTDYSLKPLVELERTLNNPGGGYSGSTNTGRYGQLSGTGGYKASSRNSSYSLLDASMGSTNTLDKDSYGGLVMMSVTINGHNLSGKRCEALVDVIHTYNCISELHLGKTHLSGHEVISLTESLSAENSSTCHTLDLRLNTIDTAGADGICQLLRRTRFLRVLNLSSTELDSRSFQEIASAISGNKSLVEFDGSFLDISDECCVGLRDMLRTNTHLQKLRLRGNNLTPVGCQTLCKGLAKNISLTVLDLSRNPIGDSGIEALASYLSDSHVTEVYIDGCGITPIGGQALAEMVSDSKRLRHLDVSTNDLQDAGITRMASALERTSSLMTVSMNMCSITNDGFSKILDAMEKNTSIHRLKLCYNKIGDHHTNPTATSDNLRYRQRIVLSSRPKLKIILWGNTFEDSK